MSDYLIQRGRFWTFFRRTPTEYADIEPRQFVAKSTKIRVADDPDRQRARRVADRLNTALEGYWRDLAQGQAAGARQRFREAVTRARRLGFDYRPMGEMIADGATLELVRRIEALEARGLLTDKPSLDAVLGTATEALIMVSGLFDEYHTHMRAELAKFPRERLRIWTNAHKAAVANFVMVLGADKPLAAVTRSDANAFRRWWGDRIADEGLKASSANIQIGQVSVMLEKVARAHDLDVAPVFAKMRFADDSEQGVPFPTAFLRDHLLAPGALDGLNAEARRVIYCMVETGLRPSEICGLEAKSIKLDADIPHVELVPNEHRRLKTKKARRLMPLVGVALKAMQAQPKGFPKYAGKAPSMSAIINQFLRANKLVPSEEHTLYSLRHSFKDRLRAVEAPGELVDMLMGHSNGGPAYGAGYMLDQKAKWLQRIALPVSPRLSV
jgi:integrase